MREGRPSLLRATLVGLGLFLEECESGFGFPRFRRATEGSPVGSFESGAVAFVAGVGEDPFGPLLGLLVNEFIVQEHERLGR